MKLEDLTNSIRSMVQESIIEWSSDGFVLVEGEHDDFVEFLEEQKVNKVRVQFTPKGKKSVPEVFDIDRNKIPELLKKGRVKVLYDENPNIRRSEVKIKTADGERDVKNSDLRKEKVIRKYAKIKSNWRTDSVR